MFTSLGGIPHYRSRHSGYDARMRLSRRSEYGLRALVDLIRHEGEGPIPLATMAERNRLPAKFLEQIGREDPREIVRHPRESTTWRDVSHGCSNRA